LLSFAAQLATESHRRPFDDAVVGGAEKRSLLDLLLDHQFRQLPQKFLLLAFSRLSCGIHAWAPICLGD
jgi:hypothetical protein